MSQKFWKRVCMSESGCWEFLGGAIFGDGYKRYNRTLAHRFSWQLHFGDIPSGMLVCHHCDNPACVNPGHLFLGTQKDNMRDMWAKGRGNPSPPSGERNHFAKLSDAQVADIRRLDMKQCDIASRYGVSRAQISRILSGKSR